MAKERKVVMGEHVVITQKDGSKAQGMVRRILRDFKGEIIVELFNGAIGKVLRLLPRQTKIILKKKPIQSQNLQNVQITPVKVVKVREKDLFSGEGSHVEYKTSALWSQDLSKDELERMKSPEVKKYGNRTSKIILAKVIAGFLNTSGGDLLIGVKEEKTQGTEGIIVGIDSEFTQLKNKDYGEDGYRRMIMDDVIRPYFPKEILNHFNTYFQITFLKKEEKTLCKISIKKSEREVFLTIAHNDYFFIRIDTQTRELRGKEMIDYIRRRF